MFPTCSEVLEVIRGLGYHKLSKEQAAELFGTDEPTGDESTEAEAVADEVL